MHCSLFPVTTFAGVYFILTLLTIRLNHFGQRAGQVQNENWTKFRRGNVQEAKEQS